MYPFAEGRKAQRKGKASNDNPYDASTTKAEQWDKGWREENRVIKALSPPKTTKAWGRWLREGRAT